MRSIDISFLAGRPGFGNLNGFAYDPSRNLFYLSHSSHVGPKVSVIYALDFDGKLVNEWDFTKKYKEVLAIASLSYDRASGHLFVGTATDILSKVKLRAVECSVDGENIFSDVVLDYGLGYFTIEESEIWATDFANDRILCFSRAGYFQSEYSLSKSFGGYPGPCDLASSFHSGFFVADHFRKLLLEFDRSGNELNAFSTASLGDGRVHGVASDSETRRLFLSVNNEKIFIISDDELSELKVPGPDHREPDHPKKSFNIDLSSRPQSPWTKAKAKKLAARLLKEVRAEISHLTLERDKLPGWVNTSSVRFGWMWDTLIFAIEDSTFSDDEFKSLGAVYADTVVLLNCKNFKPTGFAIPVSKDIREVIFGSYEHDDDYSRGSEPKIVLEEDSAFLACGLVQGHGPIIATGFCYMTKGSDGPKSMRMVPVVLYLTWQDNLINQDRTVDFFKKRLIAYVQEMHMSAAGSDLKTLRQRDEAIESTKQETVIVLGSYKAPHLDELLTVRDYVRTRKYDGKLIRDFSDLPGMSPPQKAEMWMAAARFSVMVDRDPSGHLIEYSVSEKQKSVLCLLRKQGQRSTSMIADHVEELAFVRIFEFNNSPLEVLDAALDWAEDYVTRRSGNV